MKIAYSWLRELLPELPPPHDLEPVLANLGLPVEEIAELPAPPENVVYGEVLECAPIEGTQLYRLLIEAGEPAPVTVVTGALNIAAYVGRANVGVALAKPGSVIEGRAVGVRAISGVASWGMVCSPRELGVGEYGGGLLLLPARTAAPGTALAQLWPAESVIDIEITPNRADALSALGVARDLGAKLETPLRLPDAGLPPEQGAPQPIPVTITQGCARFVARVARGVRNGPSPLFIQRRLLASGLRPIDLIVDASNYAMLELGQPTALYDARDLAGEGRPAEAGDLLGGLAVDGARQGETVQTLYGDEKTLTQGDLVIRNAAGRIVGVAGIIGADFGGVRADTAEVVLEAANFDPVKLRLTARRLDLRTDAVYRFERGVDPGVSPWAADRIMGLLAAYGGAAVDPGVTDEGKPHSHPPVAFSPQAARDLLGMDISDDEMRRILEELGCEVSPTSSELWNVTPPSWRFDLNIQEDFTEEVARLHGFSKLPETLPTLQVDESNLGAGEASSQRRALRAAFVGLGFQEVVTYTFTSDEEAERARAERPTLRLRNPLTSERTGMRAALYPSLLRAATANPRERLLLFEVGRVFPASGEAEHFGALMRGPLAPATWQPALEGGFYAFKGLIEAAAGTLGAALEVRQLSGARVPGALHPGVAGEVIWNGEAVGWIGALHPGVARAFDLRGETLLFEASFPLPGRTWTFHDPLRAPANVRDLAVIAPADVTYGEVRDVLRAQGGDLLEAVEPFDVYAGPPIPAGQRSVAVRLTFRAARTLGDAEVDPIFARMIGAVRARGWEIRAR